MVTIRPEPAATIRGATARATRNAPVTFVSITSRKPSGVTSQNGCGVGEEPRVDGAHPDPGVVDEHVEPAEPIPDLVDGGVDRGLVADVELHAQRVGPEPLRRGLRPGQLAARGDDAGAGGAQRGGHRRAQTARGAGDHHTRAGQFAHVHRT